MNRIMGIAAIAACFWGFSSSAFGQLTEVGVFSGSAQENFEEQSYYADGSNPNPSGVDTLSLFGGAATMSSAPTGSNQLWIYQGGNVNQPGWDLSYVLPVIAAPVFDGDKGLALYNGAVDPTGPPVDALLSFSSSVGEFGTYVGAVQGEVVTLTAFDGNTNLGSVSYTGTGSSTTLDWLGFEANGGNIISSIEFSGSPGGPVFDSMRVQSTPEPFTMGLGIAGIGIFVRRRMKTRA